MLGNIAFNRRYVRHTLFGYAEIGYNATKLTSDFPFAGKLLNCILPVFMFDNHKLSSLIYSFYLPQNYTTLKLIPERS